MPLRLASLAPALLVALLATAAACTPAAAPPTASPTAVTPAAPAGSPEPGDASAQPGGGGGSAGDAGDPVGVEPLPPVDEPPPADGAVHVQPEPGIVNAIAHAWDHIRLQPDGRTMTVYYWGGVEACYGLAGVDVRRNADGLLEIQVFEGQHGDLAPDTACIEIALLKAVTVLLEEPLIVPVG